MNELWLNIVRNAARAHGLDGEVLLGKLPPMPPFGDLKTHDAWLRLIDPYKLKTSIEENMVIEKSLSEFLTALRKMAGQKLRTEFKPGQG